MAKKTTKETEKHSEAEVASVPNNCACLGCRNENCICAGGSDADNRQVCNGAKNCKQTACSFASINAIQTDSGEKRIEYIPVNALHPHPDNPRKDVGDVSELAESLKVNGVLQNLTVVPLYGELTHDIIGYTVVIGHRRLAAAKLAGLETVPCIVSGMTGMQQIRTMLTENMQRTDLTVYEQAQGFQMMLDLGDSVADISERTGFSATTVRRRMKLLELDKEKFKKAATRGATLMDFAELEKIEDLDRRNEVLATIGTQNFRDALKKAIDDEAFEARKAEWEKVLATFATKIEKQGYIGDQSVPMDYVRNYSRWTPKDVNVEKPDNADTIHYYYRVSGAQIDLYKDHQERVITEEDRKREAERVMLDQMQERLRELTQRHHELRTDFVRDFGKAKKHIPEISAFACCCIVGDGKYGRDEVDPYMLDELLGLDIEEDMEYDDLKALVAEKAMQSPEYTLLAIAYASVDDGSLKYWKREWSGGKQGFEISHKDDADLDRVYALLEALGYEMSDEEKAMKDGTHELLQSAEV